MPSPPHYRVSFLHAGAGYLRGRLFATSVERYNTNFVEVFVLAPYGPSGPAPEPIDFDVPEETVHRDDYENIELWTTDELKLAMNELSRLYASPQPSSFYQAVIAVSRELLRRKESPWGPAGKPPVS